MKFCAREKAVHRGDVCICTCRTEPGGVKQRNNFEKARTCVGERRSRRQVTALPRTSLGTLSGQRGGTRCIFALFARRHWRGKEMRNAKLPRAATHRDQLLESDAHTSIKRVRARRKAGTRFPALPPRADKLPPRRGTQEAAAATNRFALLASFAPQGFSSAQWRGLSCRLVSCKLAPSGSQ